MMQSTSTSASSPSPHFAGHAVKIEKEGTFGRTYHNTSKEGASSAIFPLITPLNSSILLFSFSYLQSSSSAAFVPSHSFILLFIFNSNCLITRESHLFNSSSISEHFFAGPPASTLFDTSAASALIQQLTCIKPRSISIVR